MARLLREASRRKTLVVVVVISVSSEVFGKDPLYHVKHSACRDAFRRTLGEQLCIVRKRSASGRGSASPSRSFKLSFRATN